MKTLRIYQITKQQAENTEYRPLDVEIEEIETEDEWNYADVIENDGDGYQTEKITETRDGLIVWRVYKEYEYSDGTTETEAEFFYVEITNTENDDRELQFVDTRKNDQSFSGYGNAIIMPYGFDGGESEARERLTTSDGYIYE